MTSVDGKEGLAGSEEHLGANPPNRQGGNNLREVEPNKFGLMVEEVFQARLGCEIDYSLWTGNRVDTR